MDSESIDAMIRCCEEVEYEGMRGAILGDLEVVEVGE